MKKVLVIEDESKIVRLIRDYLSKEGYKVLDARDGEEGLDLFKRNEPGLVILDLMLPDLDGFEIAKRIRKDSDTPIIMLTAKTEEVDRVAGLEVGADDYMTKPFSLRELAARIKAVLRRTKGEFNRAKIIEEGPLKIDLETHEVKLNGKTIDLTPTEFNLLAVLAQSPGKPFTRLALLEEIGKYPTENRKRVIDTHIKNLRKKIERDDCPETMIETVHGVGYRFPKKQQ